MPQNIFVKLKKPTLHSSCGPWFGVPAVKVQGTNIGSDGVYKRIIDNYCNSEAYLKASMHTKEDKILSHGSKDGLCDEYLYITNNNSLPARSK